MQMFKHGNIQTGEYAYLLICLTKYTLLFVVNLFFFSFCWWNQGGPLTRHERPFFVAMVIVLPHKRPAPGLALWEGTSFQRVRIRGIMLNRKCEDHGV